MRRDLLLASIAAIMLLGTGAAAASAQTAGSVRLEGSARTSSGQSGTKLALLADAADSSGYHLESSLVMTLQEQPKSSTSRLTYLDDDDHDKDEKHGRDEERREKEPARQDQPRGLSGTFKLSGPDRTVTGKATGTIGGNGLGSLTLEGRDGGDPMNADLAIASDGRLQMDLFGISPAAQQAQIAATPALQPNQAAATLATSSQPEGDHTFWYLARAAGLTAYLMLFVNVFLGMAVHLRPLDGLIARWRGFDLHQFTALLAIGFMLLHALSLLGDSYIGFTTVELLIPFFSPYRPLWTALGVIAFYMVLAVFASSHLRRFIGHRAWRAIHFLSFGAFLLVMGHGLFAGTDSGEPWAAAIYGATGAVMALLVALRLKGTGGRPAARQPVNTQALKSDGARAA